MALFRIPAKRRKSNDADAHLDADTLAAFGEHVLSVRDEATVFAHLAVCGTCRDYLAVNAELKDFEWSVRAPQGRSLPGTLNISRSIRAAAGIAGSVAALWLLFSSHSPLTLVPGSKGSVGDWPITRSTDRPILNGWKTSLVRKPDGQSSDVASRSTQSTATLDLALEEPWEITTGLRKLSLQRLATNDFLAARNSHRFLKEVTLATVSFGGAVTTRDGGNGTAGINQIVLKTKFGERWITFEGLGKVRTDSGHSNP
jgi:hypothetical protein